MYLQNESEIILMVAREKSEKHHEQLFGGISSYDSEEATYDQNRLSADLLLLSLLFPSADMKVF